MVVTFTGGMGAQIISAAIYWHLKEDGRYVLADLSYFDRDEYIATTGNAGEISHWSWQLDSFGLSRSSFDIASSYSRHDVELIEDGPKKMELGVSALLQPNIQMRFPIAEITSEELPIDFHNGYLCVHVRRGDYLNVASHLVSDEEFFELADKFSGLLKHLVVVSDSPIATKFRKRISVGYERVAFLDDVDAQTSHRVMRRSRVLICSNSQFSLIAALLSPHILVIFPKQWFGEGDRAIEAPIHSRCTFEIMK